MGNAHEIYAVSKPGHKTLEGQEETPKLATNLLEDRAFGSDPVSKPSANINAPGTTHQQRLQQAVWVVSWRSSVRYLEE